MERKEKELRRLLREAKIEPILKKEILDFLKVLQSPGEVSKVIKRIQRELDDI